MYDTSLKTTHALLDSCPVALLLIAENGDILGFNTAFRALVGDAADMLQEAPQPDSLITPLLGPGTLLNWIMPDGDERWLAVDTTSIEDAPGITARFFTDITAKLRLKKERDALQVKLGEQAIKDEQLSSLLSRYGIQVSLEPMVSRSRRYNSPLSIITMGIDTTGDRDQTLRKIVYLLSDQTRWADLVGCNASHDFILVLQETTQDSALILVDKLAAQIARMNEAADSPVAACYGVTQCQKNDDATSLLERAESALTEARRNDSGTSIAI
ncbi:MAG: diguanylate cyclase [Gammaproteobacteria bacterium]|nr:diguanylate cyclase [Gammaproteobacteria bacterium]